MSTSSTPSRPRPALVIPGIESRNLYEVKHTTMPCHGLPTPPQSALESRRPSLQFSAMTDYTASAGSTIGAFSHPSTPVRGLNRHGEPYNQSWSEHAATATNTPSNHLVHSLSETHLSHPLLQPTFQPQQAYQTARIDYVEQYADGPGPHAAGPLVSSDDAPTKGIWPTAQHAQTSLQGEVYSGLGPPLFAISHQLGPESSPLDPLGIQTSSLYHQHSFHPSVDNFHGYSALQNSIYNQPQVVVPSQLSPQNEFAQQQYHALTSAHNVQHSYSTSFDSSTGSLGDFEMVRPPTPASAYFAQSDEEDYMLMNSERFESPSYTASLRRSTGTRSRKRSTKRVRNGVSNVTYNHTIGNIDVSCDFNPTDGIPTRSGGSHKNFRCKHLLGNGAECGAGFDRGEHLKRHAKKHTDVREYPCPMPKCHKAIQRPDNATDHFKTHLKPDKRGKRNKHFDWTFMRRSILHAYDDSVDNRRRATRLVDNLQKWIDHGMPESTSQRRGVTQS